MHGKPFALDKAHTKSLNTTYYFFFPRVFVFLYKVQMYYSFFTFFQNTETGNILLPFAPSFLSPSLLSAFTKFPYPLPFSFPVCFFSGN